MMYLGGGGGVHSISSSSLVQEERRETTCGQISRDSLFGSKLLCTLQAAAIAYKEKEGLYASTYLAILLFLQAAREELSCIVLSEKRKIGDICLLAQGKPGGTVQDQSRVLLRE